MSLEVDLLAKLVEGPHGKLAFLIRYGSLSGNDEDYLGVYTGLSRTSSFSGGALDIWAISVRDCEEYIKLLDPFVSEPLLTGNLVSGSSTEYEKFHSSLINQSPSVTVIRHLLSRSMQLYIASNRQLLEDNSNSPSSNREFWSRLSFSFTYWTFAKYYSCHRTAISVKQLLNWAPKVIKQIWEEAQQYKSGAEPRHGDLIDRWGQIIMQDK